MDTREKITLEALEEKIRKENAVQEKLNTFIQQGDSKNVERLLKDVEPTADVNLLDKSHGTPLMRAAGQGHARIVEILLVAKADVNATTNPNPKDQRGMTALGVAAMHDKPEVVKLLIDAKADLEIKDIAGNTPLLESASRGRLQPVQTLLEANADVNTTNNKGQGLQDVTKNEDIKNLIKSKHPHFFTKEAPAHLPVAQPRSNIDDGRTKATAPLAAAQPRSIDDGCSLM